eukprot:CAMPEP_0181314168 /NCGR_PEP_ID=MMETSP1101-20121128/14664_1 /TAXON_ID=46948 /ORGANISM="Rhodomonas abbreviata, Strain Caron Lab Isolate" /LENGTH=489 /DNA_ID=CAMNT_0023421223 /DNA_START=24 /DNA_END=1489 /DNA_ORIENTATION=+
MEQDGMQAVALTEESAPASQEEGTTRSERWKQRLEIAGSVMSWLAPRARPMAEQAATIAKKSGAVVGSVIKTGGTVIGAGIAGVGILAVGGPAGATVVAVGGVVGAGSYLGGWITEKVGEGAALGIEFSGVVTEKSLYASEGLISGINSVLTNTQMEILLGREGAAVFQHVIDIHKTELAETMSDTSFFELIQGMVAYTCLQRALQVTYSNRGFISSIGDPQSESVPRGARAFRRDDTFSTAFSRDAIEGGQELKEVIRHVEIAHAVYGAAHNVLVGDGKAKEVLEGNDAMLIRFLQLAGEEDIIASQWESPGPHSPCYILVADRAHNHLVLAIRGTMSSGDILTDLRCRSGQVRITPDSDLETVHMGMWESAVRLDGELSHIVEHALRPGGKCEGMALRLTGHSLGAGVASLLALRWQARFPSLHCFAFAPPCTVSPRLAALHAHLVTSVVLADDVVCRWSLGSTMDVLRAAGSLAKEKGALQRLIRT